MKLKKGEKLEFIFNSGNRVITLHRGEWTSVRTDEIPQIKIVNALGEQIVEVEVSRKKRKAERLDLSQPVVLRGEHYEDCGTLEDVLGRLLISKPGQTKWMPVLALFRNDAQAADFLRKEAADANA